MTQQQRTATEERQILTEEETARYLTMSTAWLRKMRRLGAAPAYSRLSRRIVYRRDDLDALLQRTRIDPERAR
jgi:predicted DNA-binding transcriptional regulator AlpA